MCKVTKMLWDSLHIILLEVVGQKKDKYMVHGYHFGRVFNLSRSERNKPNLRTEKRTSPREFDGKRRGVRYKDQASNEAMESLTSFVSKEDATLNPKIISFLPYLL